MLSLVTGGFTRKPVEGRRKAGSQTLHMHVVFAVQPCIGQLPGQPVLARFSCRLKASVKSHTLASATGRTSTVGRSNAGQGLLHVQTLQLLSMMDALKHNPSYVTALRIVHGSTADQARHGTAAGLPVPRSALPPANFNEPLQFPTSKVIAGDGFALRNIPQLDSPRAVTPLPRKAPASTSTARLNQFKQQMLTRLKGWVVTSGPKKATR
jgi:hypothetical protein